MCNTLVGSHKTFFLHCLFFLVTILNQYNLQKAVLGISCCSLSSTETQEMQQLTSTRIALFYIIYSFLAIGAAMRINV